MSYDISIIIPAKNEALGLRKLLPEIKSISSGAEIIVVNDGSSDDTLAVCSECGVECISHPHSLGNGAAIKTGARAAKNPVLLFMDADGQHQPQDIPRLLEKFEQGFDMVVGARTRKSQAGMHRAIANGFYNVLASWMVGHPVDDLTSGFRVVNALKFRKFLHLLPNGFSYPTTTTMSFFRAGFPVAYVPIHAPRRIGKSHVKMLPDGVRFLLIIFKIGTLYSPFKIFLPVSLVFFITGVVYSAYTIIANHHFTNMSALMLITAVLVFLIGLVSEQITGLLYKDTER